MRLLVVACRGVALRACDDPGAHAGMISAHHQQLIMARQATGAAVY